MGPRVARRRRRLATRLTVAALVWAVGLLVAALALPAFNDQTTSNVNGLTLGTATFVQVNGGGVLIPILLPLLAGAVTALAIRQRRRGNHGLERVAWPTIGVLAVVAAVTLPSIGILAVPVVVLLGLALRVTDVQVPTPEPGPVRAAGAAPESPPRG